MRIELILDGGAVLRKTLQLIVSTMPAATIGGAAHEVPVSAKKPHVAIPIFNVKGDARDIGVYSPVTRYTSRFRPGLQNSRAGRINSHRWGALAVGLLLLLCCRPQILHRQSRTMMRTAVAMGRYQRTYTGR
jgi:hypothetical protein